MSRDESDFRIRPGRPRSTRAPRPKSFINQVLRAAQHARIWDSGGRSSRSGGAAKSGNGSRFGRGRYVFARNRLFGSHRRVVVAARIARHRGRAFRAAPLSTHLSYLKREGVSRDGAQGIMFDAESDRADDTGFTARCRDDRHHFRFTISPEDAGEMEDLKGFTRDLTRQMEADLGTALDWIAADHWNTDNPHVHLLVRGVDQDGADLVISRDYISAGLRSRAVELVELELGPRPEHEIRQGLEREITAERWTRLDREIRSRADEFDAIDLRPERPGADDPEIRRMMIGRLQHLRRMGLAAEGGPGEWMLDADAEQRLRDLGQRGDIIKSMHRAFTERGMDRGIADYVIDAGRHGPPIIGRLIDKGLHDELTGEAFAVIDATDGRAHHVRLRGIEAFEHAPPLGGIVELRRFGGREDPRPTLVLANRSDLDLSRQVTAPGATWLDHRLVEHTPLPLAMGGFGNETREAMKARAEHLADVGLARRQGQRVILQRNLLASLRRRELEQVGVQIAAETGLAHVTSKPGEHVAGTYRRQLSLSSGRFAMIETIGPDGGPSFQLVPWSREIDRKLGQHISGIAKESGGIDWSLGRKRGLGL